MRRQEGEDPVVVFVDEEVLVEEKASTIREGTRPSARRAFFPLGGTIVETPRMAIC